MTTIRTRLRLWATAWLVFQVSSLSALVPHACCIGHQPVTTQEPSCHQHSAAPHCQKMTDDPTCPLHKLHTASHQVEETSTDTCSMRGMCDGPMASILALLSNQGVLAKPLSISPHLEPGSATSPTHENLITRLAAPDPPPPRA